MPTSTPIALILFVSLASIGALGFLTVAWLLLRSRTRADGLLRSGLEDSLRRELQAELRLSRQELAESVGRAQAATAESFQNALQDVQVSLGETERRWGEVQRLGDSVARLKDIFEQPARRGRVLGEVTLERLLADCLPPGYFAFQHPIGPLRVDAAVLFPHAGVCIPIDSKFPESGEPAVILKRAREIATKYVRPDLGTTPYAYLYLPTEALWHEAVSAPKVWEELVSLRVYPVSPHTLALALHGAAQGVAYFERGLRAREVLAELDARRTEIQAIRDGVEGGMAAARKAMALLARAGEDAASLEEALRHVERPREITGGIRAS